MIFKNLYSGVPQNLSRDARSFRVKTRRAMYVKRDIEGRSCSHCCSGQAI